MTIASVLIGTLLILTVVVEVFAVVGLFALRTTMERLHLVGPATCVGPVLCGIAVLLGTHATPNQAAKGLLIAFVMLAFAGVLSHETGCAAVAHEGRPD